MDLLRLNTLRGTKTVFLTPRRYDEHPVLFIWELCPLGSLHYFGSELPVSEHIEREYLTLCTPHDSHIITVMDIKCAISLICKSLTTILNKQGRVTVVTEN